MSSHGTPPGPDTVTGPAPPARRLRRVRWRDPRLAIGVVLVAGSVVLGARVLATADDTTPIWTLRSDLTAGAALDADLVEATDVRLLDDEHLAFYLSASEPLPEGLVLAHDTPAGELLAHSGVESAAQRQGAELPLPVRDGALPPDLASGDRVDVWVTPEPGQSTQDRAAEQVLAGAAVLGVERSVGSLAGGSGAVVLVALDDSDTSELPGTLAAVGQGSVVLVRVEG